MQCPEPIPDIIFLLNTRAKELGGKKQAFNWAIAYGRFDGLNNEQLRPVQQWLPSIWSPEIEEYLFAIGKRQRANTNANTTGSIS